KPPRAESGAASKSGLSRREQRLTAIGAILAPTLALVPLGARAMTAWTVKDSNGQLLSQFVAASPIELRRRIVPPPYHAFRLEVSCSYRALFDRALSQVLEREGWQIVRARAPQKRSRCQEQQIALAA